VFDQTTEQPVVRRGLSRKGWAKMVLFYCAASYVLIILFDHLAYRDDQIATRERIVTGTVLGIHKGKNDTADYVYQFEGVNYRNHDDCDYLELTEGAKTKVFVDPLNPQTSGLRSYHFKQSLHSSCKTFAIYLSIALTILSAFLWLRVLNNGEIENIEENS
jgi:hypothetical protein